jgi:chromosome segregation ATPase
MQAGTEAERQQRAEVDGKLRHIRADLDRLRREVDEKRMSADAAEREKRRLEYEMEELTKVADALR